jgi:hypothetical protein
MTSTRPRAFIAASFLALALGLAPAARPGGQREVSTFSSSLMALLPQASGEWRPAEHPRQYLPETLFEYIDGAAESYLSYNFQELLVAQYAGPGSPAASLTVEVYDMGTPLQAFGIYSVERYPESRFLPIGVQGYYEDGSLNFLGGRYYVKLMCYDCGSEAEAKLAAVARDIAGKIPEPGALPPQLSAFPREGLVTNSEKFILRNFLGLAFLGNGFQASYRLGDLEFECFIVENPDPARAEAVTREYLENYRRAGDEIRPLPDGWTFTDKYLRHVFVARAGRCLAGVTRIPEGSEETGRSYLARLVESLGGLSGPVPVAAGR